MSDVVYVILAVVTLGYLGLGIQAPQPDWGSMIFDGQLVHDHALVAVDHPRALRGRHRHRPVADRRRAGRRAAARMTAPARSQVDGARRRDHSRDRETASAPSTTSRSRSHRGRSIGLVGESGCGKSISLRAIMGLLPDAARAVAGSVSVSGRSCRWSGKKRGARRGAATWR